MPLPIRRITPQPKPLRVRPQQFAPLFNSGGTTPGVTEVRRRPPPLRARAQLYAPPFTSGGQAPGTLHVERLLPPRQKHPSQLVVSQPFNSGGLVPTVTMVARRPPPSRARRQQYVLPAPPFNSGGAVPTVTMVARRPPLRHWKAFQSAPLFIITAGVMPVVSRGVKRPPPTRDHRNQYVLTAASFNSGGFSSTVTAGVRRINRSRPLSRMVVPPPPGAPPPTSNPAVSAGFPLQLFV